MLPAGEMWSVVMESPNRPSTRAPCTSSMLPTAIDMPSKYGGFLMYVELPSHAYRSPSGEAMVFQRVSPLNTSA